MAAKYFCDACGVEVQETANRCSWSVEKSATQWPKASISVEATITIDGTTNGGHICPMCVIRTLDEGQISRKTFR
jgi:hypothetical protein